jgi:hypothetical protein
LRLPIPIKRNSGLRKFRPSAYPWSRISLSPEGSSARRIPTHSGQAATDSHRLPQEGLNSVFFWKNYHGIRMESTSSFGSFLSTPSSPQQVEVKRLEVQGKTSFCLNHRSRVTKSGYQEFFNVRSRGTRATTCSQVILLQQEYAHGPTAFSTSSGGLRFFKPDRLKGHRPRTPMGWIHLSERLPEKVGGVTVRAVDK